MRFSSAGPACSKPRQAAEGVQQALRELQDTDTGQAGAQQQGDQLRIGQRRRAEREQPLARARAGAGMSFSIGGLRTAPGGRAGS